MQSRPRVALLIETSNAYARDLLYGIRSYVREHASWSIYLTEHGRGEALPEWIHKWEGEGIIARVENQTIADALLKTGTPTVDVSFGLERSPFPRAANPRIVILASMPPDSERQQAVGGGGRRGRRVQLGLRPGPCRYS